MSRLPRLHSDQNDNATMQSNKTALQKRKATYTINEEDEHPLKFPAVGAIRPIHGQPLREIRKNVVPQQLPSLTIPKPPELTKSTTASRMARATSAPPKSSSIRSVSASRARPMTTAAGRVPNV